MNPKWQFMQWFVRLALLTAAVFVLFPPVHI